MKRRRGIPADAASAATPAGAGAADVIFRKGQFIPISFANWDGNNGEVGSKHTLTPWFWLLLPPDTNYAMIYGASLGTTLAFFLVGLVLVWSMRRTRAGAAERQR